MEDTNLEINIELTKEARLKVNNYLATVEDFRGKALRLYIDGKGCDGFYYGVGFDQASDEDLKKSFEGFDLVVDKETYSFVKGATIEWADDERGQGFIVENPNHRKFRGKFFRRKTWKERLLGDESPSVSTN